MGIALNKLRRFAALMGSISALVPGFRLLFRPLL